MNTLTGRVALVTGATRGIGRAIALALARAGATLFLVAEGPQRALADIADQCRALDDDVRVHAHAFDLEQPDAPGAMVQAALAACGRIDVLVNAAAVRCHRPFGEFTAGEFDRLVAVNLRAPFLASQAAAAAMRAQGGGRIIHIGSELGLVAAPQRALYATAKAALIHLTRAMALELAASAIAVNCVSPGPTEVEHTRERCALDASLYERVAAGMPIGRWVQPEEVASAVLFLATTDARAIQGHNLVVDGGLTLA